MTPDFDDPDAHFAQRLAALDDNLRLGGEAESTGEAGDVDTRLKSAREVLELLHAAFQGDAGGDPPPATPKPATRERIGRFVVEGILGEGSFGRVYRARDGVLGRAVALKVAKVRDWEAEQSIKRFEREAKALAVLRHPNIVTLFDYGRDGDDFYIALALIPGRTLQEEIALRKNAGTLDARWAAETAAAVADALAYAHASGIVHRDVKPGNVLIDEAGTPHLTDFGLAADREGLERLTHTGQMLGTPLYMSPEQVRGERGTTTAASDQYSLGVVLFELLTGRTPFTGPPEKVIVDHLETDAPSPRKFNASVPRDLATICMKCLRKEPAKRYAGCQELADDLRAWRRGDAIKARPMGVVERAMRAAKRRPWTAVLGGVASFAILGLGFLGWYLRGVSVGVDLTNRHYGYAGLLRQVDQALKDRREFVAAKILDSSRQLIHPLPPGFEWSILKQMAEHPIRSMGGHTSQTCAATFSQDGKWLAASSREPRAEVWIWDTTKWIEEAKDWRREKLELGYPRLTSISILHLRFSPDGRYFASMDSAGVLVLSDFQTRREIGRTQAPAASEIFFVDNSGKLELVVRSEKRLYLYSVPELRAVRSQSFEHTLSALAASFDGKRIAVAELNQDHVKLLDASTLGEVGRFQRQTTTVIKLAFSRDDKKLAACHDNHLKVWNLSTGKSHVVEKEKFLGFLDIAFAAGGEELITLSDSEFHCVDRWRIASGEHLSHFVDPSEDSKSTTQIDVSPDGQTIILPGRRDFVLQMIDRCWTISGERVIPAHSAICFSLAFTADSKHVVSCSEDQKVHLWEVESGKHVRSFGPFTESIYDVAISPDGRKLVTCDDHRFVTCWDFVTTQCVWKKKQTTDRISVLRYTHDGQAVFFATQDGICQALDSKSGDKLHSFNAGKGFKGMSMALHPKDNRVVAVTELGTVYLWNSSTGKSEKVFDDVRLNGARQVVWSPDGHYALCADPHANAVFRLDLDQRQVAEQMFELAGAALAISPDGMNAVTGVDGQLTFFDVKSRLATLQLQMPRNDKQCIRAIAFSPDGRTLGVACMDGTLRLWRR